MRFSTGMPVSSAELIVARCAWKVFATGRSFRESFVRERGYRDGLRGVALGLLWSLYRTAAEVMLLRELRRRG